MTQRADSGKPANAWKPRGQDWMLTKGNDGLADGDGGGGKRGGGCGGAANGDNEA
jgi:hypothetical protein